MRSSARRRGVERVGDLAEQLDRRALTRRRPIRDQVLGVRLELRLPIAHEWPAFGVVEVDQDLAERAASLAFEGPLPSLDALYLASALLLPRAELCFATWDHRLSNAARDQGLRVLAERLDSGGAVSVR